MSFLKPTTPTVAPPVQPEAPPPVLAPQGSKPGAKKQTASFLGSADIANQPQTSGGGFGKTLLGQ